MPSGFAHLFGPFELLDGDIKRDLPPSSNAQLILAYLLLHPGRGCSRSVLAGLIAPELPEAQALRALSQALWHVRRALPGWLDSDAYQVCFSPQIEISTDALEFDTLVEPHLSDRGQPSSALRDLMRAVALYRGELLEGYYQDWVLLERERLRELYLQALEQLETAYKSALQYQQALSTALRWVSADPLNESAYREVMRLYHYLGCPAEALRQYEKCQEMLRQEFGLEPEIETSQIAQAIRQRSQNFLAPHLPEPPAMPGVAFVEGLSHAALPLIGRSAERASLANWLQPGKGGNGSLILVEGEAGVGKTRLLQEAARDGEWRGMQVLWGKAMPLTDNRPLAPLVAALESGLNPLRVGQLQHLVAPLWLQVLQPLLPGLAHNLPGPDPLPALESHQALIRLLDGLFQLLVAWTQINPLVIIVEDIHWANAETVDILAGLAEYLEKENVSLIFSYRRDELVGLPEIQAKLEAIQPEVVRGRLALTGLGNHAVHELIEASLGGGETSPIFEEALHRESRGNPLFILEILRGLYDEGVLNRSETGTWITPYDSAMGEVDLPLPPAVEQVIVRRLEQLPPDLRNLLEGLAMLGGEFSFESVICLGLADAPTVVAWLQALCKRRLLIESVQAYRFSHDKIRQVVYESLSATQRTAWHVRLAAALEQAHPDQVEALALHFSEGEVWSKALEYQRRAAEMAQAAQVYTTALEHWNRVLQAAVHLSLAPEVHFGYHAAHETVLDVLGRRDAQAAALEAMIRLAQDSPLQLSEALRRKGRLLLNLGRFAEAEETARQALHLIHAPDRSLAPEFDRETSQAQAMIALAEIILYRGTHDLDEALALFQSAKTICQASGNLSLEADVHDRLARFDRGLPFAVRRDEAQTALALYTRLGDRAGEAKALCEIGYLCYEMGEPSAVTLGYYHRSIETARATGHRLVEARATSNLGSALLQVGQVGQAIEAFTLATAIFEKIGDIHRAVFTRLQLIRVQCLLIGPDPAIKAQAENLLSYCKQIENQTLIGYTQFLLGIMGWREQQFQSAETWLDQAARSLPSSPGSELIRLLVHQCQAHLKLEQGQPDKALELQEKLLLPAQQGGYVGLEVGLLAGKGLSLLVLGHGEAALACTTDAMARFTPAVELSWMTPFAHYQVLHSLGKHSEAYAALEKANGLLCEMLASLTPEQQAMSRTHIKEHHEILRAWQSIQPKQINIRLPRADAPLGCPLHDDEWIEVNWTVAAPDDETIGGKVERRRQRLLRLLQEAHTQGATATIESLALALGVSSRTISMDIAALEREYAELLCISLRGRSSP